MPLKNHKNPFLASVSVLRVTSWQVVVQQTMPFLG